jgi:hypothetical protein
MKIDVVDLAVALDSAEDAGLTDLPAPDPDGHPENCVYLRRANKEVAALFANRLPHTSVQFHTMGGAGRSKVVRLVYHKAAILHVFHFLQLPAILLARYTRALNTVDRKYWKVVR